MARGNRHAPFVGQAACTFALMFSRALRALNHLLLIAAGPGLAAAAPPVYKTYHNLRFGYRIDYPADLRPASEADNRDGRRFVSADGHTVLTAYAGYLVLEGGLDAERAIARRAWRQQQATITLDQRTRTGPGFVLSGQVKGMIFYERTVLNGNTRTTFRWEYPAARKALMDGFIWHTLQTLHPGGTGRE